MNGAVATDDVASSADSAHADDDQRCGGEQSARLVHGRLLGASVRVRVVCVERTTGILIETGLGKIFEDALSW